MRKHFKNWAVIAFAFWVFISVFAPLIATEQALIVKDKEGIAFPFISNYQADESSISFQLNAPIPYSPQTIDYDATGAKAPFQTNTTSTLRTHWLGTDFIGRDILSNLIHGSKSAFVIGLFSMLLAAIIGICLGGLSAIYTNNEKRINIKAAILIALLITIYTIQVYILPWKLQSVSTFSNILMLLLYTAIMLLLSKLILKFFNTKNKTFIIPIAPYINRSIEIIESLPMLFLLVTLNSIIHPSYFSIIVIIALVAWPTFARFSRAEFLKIMNLSYIESADALGYSKSRILFKHVLPSAISPLLITFVFGVVSAILVESTLSFMGLGLANESASWGEMINLARRDYSAWWLAVFPGATLFFVLIVLNRLSSKMKSL